MGDIFKREAAANPQAFTGERLTSALEGQTQIEHYHRYLFARSFCAGRDVLDVASGEGYGSAQLAQVARSVVGVEYSEATARSAAENFPRDNLRFVQGDARALPLADASVDVAVSFETIEHFDGQEAFLAELRRVLRPDGLLIVSTPDRDIYSPSNAAPNEYHVRELSRLEFIALLRQRFSHIELLLQRPMIGSALMPEQPAATPALVFDRRGQTHFESCDVLPRAPYIVAVAANRPIPPLPASLFVERSDLDTERMIIADRVKEIEALRALFGAATSQTERSQDLLTEFHATAIAATEEARRVTQEAAAQLAVLRAEADRYFAELDRTRGSARTFLRHYLPRLRRHFLGR